MAEFRTVQPEELPFSVEEVEHFLIPMSDRAQLAARRWIPVGADDASHEVCQRPGSASDVVLTSWSPAGFRKM
jgi:hypothetical protein